MMEHLIKGWRVSDVVLSAPDESHRSHASRRLFSQYLMLILI